MFALTVSVGPELMLVVQITGEDQGQPWPSRTQVEKARCPVLPPSLKLSMEHNDIPKGSLRLWEQRRCEELAAKTGTSDCESWELGVKTSSQGSTEGGVMRPVPALSAPSAFVCSSPCSFRDRRSPFNLIDILCFQRQWCQHSSSFIKICVPFQICPGSQTLPRRWPPTPETPN